ncbi:MAG: intradiol ring-cleavage dioxygenase [Gammaproteobacteria bacterium]|nr:intradiol ring-cleavage dioxygenase [Gammaproteobacteria bacterium]
MNRRKLVRTAMAAGVLTGAAPFAVAELPRTPRDYTGPFYPRGPRNRTNDLIAGKPRTDVLSLAGRVLTPAGSPHAGVVVDIWQADPNGRYKHPRDRGQDALLEEFLYWGESTTDGGGAFTFRTYVPGSYPARPAQHIHYKVWTEDREPLLTSQIYFAQLGGAGRYARSDGTTELQTTDLLRETDTVLRATIDIVI